MNVYVSYDRSIASSKPSSPPSVIDCFLFRFPVSSLFQSQSSYLRLLLRIPVTYLHPSIFTSITCFRRQFLRKMWPFQLAFFCLLYVGYSSPPWLSVTLLHFSHDRSILLQHHISKPIVYFEEVICCYGGIVFTFFTRRFSSVYRYTILK
jgi:hypothetical protein